jgi:hypothetical protein
VKIVIAFWIHILEEPGLNFRWNTNYPDRFLIVLLSPFKQMPGWYLD